ncbi:hypothetical protein, partial [Acinetobacter baumannii]|uniref:hypothetical protein n=1 Tax=Acinetobacter baumannii TaxID=470 RepID=UPI001D0D7E90
MQPPEAQHPLSPDTVAEPSKCPMSEAVDANRGASTVFSLKERSTVLLHPLQPLPQPQLEPHPQLPPQHDIFSEQKESKCEQTKMEGQNTTQSKLK